MSLSLCLSLKAQFMCIVKINKTSVYAKGKARVFMVYNSHIDVLCVEKNQRREFFFRIHIDIKTSKPTKPANNGTVYCCTL